jgi:sulfate adenylyltransferase subunit 2
VSFRDQEHAWDPRNQRPELWNLYNTRIKRGESLRVFPLSNWTELDIWSYIRAEEIPVVPLYLSAQRRVVRRDGMLILVDDDRLPVEPQEMQEVQVRFRTLGCYPLTAAVESAAEISSSRQSERHGRLIEFDEAGSMERKKREGYF